MGLGECVEAGGGAARARRVNGCAYELLLLLLLGEAEGKQ